jgi:hypothetical protein
MRRKAWIFSLAGLLILFGFAAGCGTDAPSDSVITGPTDGSGITVPAYTDLNATYSVWFGPLQFKVESAAASTTTTTSAKALSKAFPGVDLTFEVTGDFNYAGRSTIRFVDANNSTTLNGDNSVILFKTKTNDGGVAGAYILIQVTCGGTAADLTVAAGVQAYTDSAIAIWSTGGITVDCTA